MSASGATDDSATIQIIVAIIGLIGTLGAAYIVSRPRESREQSKGSSKQSGAPKAKKPAWFAPLYVGSGAWCFLWTGICLFQVAIGTGGMVTFLFGLLNAIIGTACFVILLRNRPLPQSN